RVDAGEELVVEVGGVGAAASVGTGDADECFAVGLDGKDDRLEGDAGADGSGVELAAGAAEEGAADVNPEGEKAATLRVDADERSIDVGAAGVEARSAEAGVDAD